MNKEIDLIEPHSNSGLSISLADMRSSLARTKRIVNNLIQSNVDIEPLLDRMKEAEFTATGQKISIKIHVLNLLLKDINNQLVLLQNLGGRFRAELSLLTDQKIPLTITKVKKFRLEVGARLRRPITEYASLSDAMHKNNQLVLDTALLIETTLESGIKGCMET
jgi:hypothetical protein